MQVSCKKVKLTFIFLLSLLVLPIVVSQPTPFFQDFSGDTGFEIKNPPVLYIRQNADYDFHFRVFNLTNGVPIIEGVTCYFHLYNQSGNHLARLEDSTVGNQFDYEFSIDKNNFTETGTYAYIIQCNDSGLGGFVSQDLIITASGEEEPNEIGSAEKDDRLIVFFGLAISIFLLIFGFWKEDRHLVAVSGIVMILLGVYVAVNGFLTLNNFFSQTIVIVLIAIGSYIFLRSSLDDIINNF